MAILVTGGIGYIGSHTVVELLNNGEQVIILDNLSNSDKSVFTKLKEITGKECIFYEADIRDSHKLDNIFDAHKIEAVIHFAGLKAVGESVEKPVEYYDNNVSGTLKLLQIMDKHECKKIVFSSSATVYGDPKRVPIKETDSAGPEHTTNPYGTSKAMIEKILQDKASADKEFTCSILRYFNPVGAHPSGLIGEDPNGIPNNLMPYIGKVAMKELPELNVFGNDYNTKDGTGVRDYIHVVDLAEAHLKALRYIDVRTGSHIHNVGTGTRVFCSRDGIII